MRGTYGPDQPYTAMAARALFLWAKYERKWKQQFLHRTGVLWMASERDDVFEGGSVGMLRSSGIKHRQLTAAQMKKRWPQINLKISSGAYSSRSADISRREQAVRR